MRSPAAHVDKALDAPTRTWVFHPERSAEAIPASTMSEPAAVRTPVMSPYGPPAIGQTTLLI